MHGGYLLPFRQVALHVDVAAGISRAPACMYNTQAVLSPLDSHEGITDRVISWG